MSTETITIEARYCGPPDSANGGYSCGRLAACLEGAVRVRLMAPPPLDVPLTVTRLEDGVALSHGDQAIARAWAEPLGLEVPEAPSLAQAEDASHRFVGHDHHLYPGCFVCGPERAVGDGLRVFAGPLADDPRYVASPWTPAADLGDGQGCVAAPFVWAALDCPGAYALDLHAGTPFLLGELHARIDGAVAVGEACTVVGWSIASEGRKHHVGTALYGADGECRARAHGTWIVLRPPEDR